MSSSESSAAPPRPFPLGVAVDSAGLRLSAARSNKRFGSRQGLRRRRQARNGRALTNAIIGQKRPQRGSDDALMIHLRHDLPRGLMTSPAPQRLHAPPPFSSPKPSLPPQMDAVAELGGQNRMSETWGTSAWMPRGRERGRKRNAKNGRLGKMTSESHG